MSHVNYTVLCTEYYVVLLLLVIELMINFTLT